MWLEWPKLDRRDPVFEVAPTITGPSFDHLTKQFGPAQVFDFPRTWIGAPNGQRLLLDYARLRIIGWCIAENSFQIREDRSRCDIRIAVFQDMGGEAYFVFDKKLPDGRRLIEARAARGVALSTDELKYVFATYSSPAVDGLVDNIAAWLAGLTHVVGVVMVAG